MATGNTLHILTPHGNEAPSSNFATLNTRNGHLVLEFDATTDESAIWKSVLSRAYAGGGITVKILWAAASATSGDCIWAAQFENDASQDIDSDGFATAKTTTTTTSGTSGVLNSTEIAFTDGAEIDSIVAGFGFRLKVSRDADAGGDTMTGDAQLWAVEIRET